LTCSLFTKQALPLDQISFLGALLGTLQHAALQCISVYSVYSDIPYPIKV